MFNDELQPDSPMASLPLQVAADLQDSLLVAANDLDRLERLLTDATETLMGHFYGASAQMNLLLRSASKHPELDSKMLHDAMQHMAGAVTAMQFQDLSQQLITHLQRRLRRCTDRLARDFMGDEDEDGEGPAIVEEAPLRPNPVTQDEMDAGSIELF
jgi:hypothetical protein